ncbi:MAG: type II secretion system F family protein [Candidatus Omnitrophota bacterium]|nr:type II secretion system F family protein [Candidatus Omnitrophota bacterium]
MAIVIALMFAASWGLFVWYFASTMRDRQVLEERYKKLQHTALQTEISKKLLRLDFSGSIRKMDLKLRFEPAQIVTLFVTFLIAAFYVLINPGLPIVNRIIIVTVIPFITVRFLTLAQKKRRLADMQLELPGALDLIVVCLESGLSINAAMLRVANEMEASPLGKELRHTFNEVSAGIPTGDALKGFARRSGLEDLKTIVTSIIQSEKLGTSMAATFRVQSETLREKYKMRMKEKINKVPVKILFPLVFFIFPALLVIILGPAIIGIMTQLGGKIT